MAVFNEQEAIDFVKANQAVPPHIEKGRENSRELFALIDGDDFIEELINRIEHLESKEKAKAREKYSRDITHLFERVLLPIDNVFSATGGAKKYSIDNEEDKIRFLNKVSNFRDGKSIQKYVEERWMKAYHTDPAGIIFMEYTTKEDIKRVWPTYKSVNVIRNYVSSGQLVSVLLFEPKNLPEKMVWRLVDEKTDWTINQNGNTFVVDKEKTFVHPFGEVPAIINSDIIATRDQKRLSPIQKIVPISREYARDQSIKTIFKFLHGFPTHWRYTRFCKTCSGVGKTGNKPCPDCKGKGSQGKNDITDIVNVPVPTKDQQKLDPIEGFITPDIKTWERYDTELELLEAIAVNTHWGAVAVKGANETATGRFIDIQPVMNRLNKYADVAEFVEWKLTEWCANFMFPEKDKSKSIALIAYGRRYIIEPPDSVLKRYMESKGSEENNTVLDRLFDEYLTAKYKNDPAWLREELLKAKVEPYLHLKTSDVNTIFDTKEARRKVFFGQWWSELDIADKQKESSVLIEKMNTDFETFLTKTFPTT